VALVCEAKGVYGEGQLFNSSRAYPYLVFVNSYIQAGAIYSLFLLFHAARAELEPIQPVAKFVCVKAVIFFSFWQAVIIVVLVHMHVLTSRTLRLKDYDVKDVANGLQEFIICIEMFIAACAHQVAFPVADFAALAPAGAAAPASSKLSDVFDMSDVYSDVRQEVSTLVDRAESVGGRMRLPGVKGRGPKVKGEEAAGLLEPAWEGDDAVGQVNIGRGDRHNLPFLNATSSYQRRSTAGENSDGLTVAQQAGAPATSPRTSPPPPTFVVTSSGGAASLAAGREVELRDLGAALVADTEGGAPPAGGS